MTSKSTQKPVTPAQRKKERERAKQKEGWLKWMREIEKMDADDPHIRVWVRKCS